MSWHDAKFPAGKRPSSLPHRWFPLLGPFHILLLVAVRHSRYDLLSVVYLTSRLELSSLLRKRSPSSLNAHAEKPMLATRWQRGWCSARVIDVRSPQHACFLQRMWPKSSSDETSPRWPETVVSTRRVIAQSFLKAAPTAAQCNLRIAIRAH